VRYYRTKICDKYILHGFIIARTWRQFCFGQTMKFLFTINYAAAVLPALLMLVAAGVPWAGQRSVSYGWRWFDRLAAAALATTLLALALELASTGATARIGINWWLLPNIFGSWVSLLVQFLGLVIGVYSARHLRGERRQKTYIAAL